MDIPPFLRLAAETRDQIYGYLLSTKHTKHYPKQEDPEWEYTINSQGKSNPTPRPTHIYRFHIAILRANWQINREASSILYAQNMFVELYSDLTTWDIDFKKLGVPIVAQGRTASSFAYSVLHINLQPEQIIRFETERPMRLIFAGADLPAFCTALLIGGESPLAIIGSSLMIDLNCNTADENTQTHASFSIPLLKNLLEPLRLLRAFQFVHITGPLDEQYTTDLCLSMCKKAPSFTESLLGVMHKKKNDQIAIKVRGNENRLFQTVKMYNTAMTGLKDRCSGFDWAVQSRLRIGHFAPSFTDIGLHIAYMEFLYRLRLNLASTHSKLEQWWQCRKWSGHAMMIVHEDPLLPVRNNASDNYYAHACRLNALSNNKLGRWEEAVTSIREAVKISPDLKQEVEEYERDLQKSKERQVKIVRVILTENRTKRNERSRVMRYPADFEKVKQRLKFIEESGEGM